MEDSSFSSWRWFKQHLEIGSGFVGGILVGIGAIWFFRQIVINVLGFVAFWLLNMLVYATHLSP